jgi:hypothetical protein
MSRTWYLSAVFAFAGLSGLSLGLGCDTAPVDPATAANRAALRACQLDDGTVEDDAELRACEPGNTKKTTICHVPPGNPDNAHTLCIGNAAVRAHLRNHDDYLGPCKRENPCPPPPTTGTGGAVADGGAGGQSDPTGAAGAGGQSDPTGAGGSAGAGGGIIVP